MAALPHRASRARLRRRLAALTEAALRQVLDREGLREQATATASIRAALEAAAIDAAGISCLRAFADAETRLARLGDTPARRRADAALAADHPRLAARESFPAKAAGRALQFADRAPPDRGASLLDWYAWSLGGERAAPRRY